MTQQEEWNQLTPEQRQRGQALLVARDILAQKGSGPFSSVSLTGATTGDVIVLAEFILDGQRQGEDGCTDCESDGDDQSEEAYATDSKDEPARAMTEDEYRAQHAARERVWTRDPQQHPAVTDALRTLSDAVLTYEEADLLRKAIKRGKRLGEERGISSGR